MTETKYTRKGNIISDMTGKVVFEGKTASGQSSINAAKRESRRLQGSALGQGLVRVEGGDL